jgi:hypothetical protein
MTTLEIMSNVRVSYWGCWRRSVTVAECWRMLPVEVVAVPVTVMV